LEVKSPLTETKNKVEGHSSRIDQADRISELNDQIEIKSKAEDILANNSGAVKGICKTSATPSKDHT
jgi:hypothetical protein